MRISFDLDDTLICYRDGALCEPRPAWWRRCWTSGEPLRRGAPSLLRSLAERGCELWIYTTSQRRAGAIRRWLRSYGVRVAGVVNQGLHQRHFAGGGAAPPSKNPAAFGIELHVDDSDGVRREGEMHGFRVVVVAPDDEAWAEKVSAAVDELLRGRPAART